MSQITCLTPEAKPRVIYTWSGGFLNSLPVGCIRFFRPTAAGSDISLPCSGREIVTFRPEAWKCFIEKQPLSKSFTYNNLLKHDNDWIRYLITFLLTHPKIGSHDIPRMKKKYNCGKSKKIWLNNEPVTCIVIYYNKGHKLHDMYCNLLPQWS